MTVFRLAIILVCVSAVVFSISALEKYFGPSQKRQKVPVSLTKIETPRRYKRSTGEWFKIEGLFIGAKSRERAKEIASQYIVARRAFVAAFRRKAPIGVVVDTDILGKTSARRLKATKWVLPWTFRDGGNLTSFHKPLRHEIGHQLFNESYNFPFDEKKSATFDAEGRVKAIDLGFQYGSLAPDWLDEMAAIALESAEQHAKRKVAFECSLNAKNPKSVWEVLDQVHPIAAHEDRVMAASAKAKEEGNFGSFRVLIPRDPKAAGSYYNQVWALMTFLLEQFPNEPVLGDIARAYEQGGDFWDWYQRVSAQDFSRGDIDIAYKEWTINIRESGPCAIK